MPKAFISYSQEDKDIAPSLPPIFNDMASTHGSTSGRLVLETRSSRESSWKGLRMHLCSWCCCRQTA